MRFLLKIQEDENNWWWYKKRSNARNEGDEMILQEL